MKHRSQKNHRSAGRNANAPSERQTNETNETVESVGQWSQVKKTARFQLMNKKSALVAGGAVGVILILMLLATSHHATPEKSVPKKQVIELNQGYENVLAENLANISKQVSSPDDMATGFSSLGDGDSKALMARQNAPQTMFTASFHPVSNQNTASKAGQNTFAGNSVYDKFANQATTSSNVSAQQIAHPRYTVASGEFIHAVLETAINSDLPGQLRAIISQPVYAYVGEAPLIPAGSRLIGQYSSAVFQGQGRVFVVWNRVILPDGVTVQLNSPGVDAMGRSGAGADSIDTHFFSRFGEGALLSIIGAGVSTIGVGTSDQYNSASQYRMAMAQSFQRSANQSLSNSLQTKPTIRIYQGAAINVFVAHDLDFYDVRQTLFSGSTRALNDYRGDHG